MAVMHRFSLRHPFDRSRAASVTPIDTREVHRIRLWRWATVLDRNPDQPLWLLRNLEAASPEASWLAQGHIAWLKRRLGDLPPGLQQLAAGLPTALTVASRDPELHRAGLTNDRYQSALRFFGLTDRDMHRILCFCSYGHETQAPAHAIAERVRAAASALPLPPID